ncbi:MAG TPA: bifunctional diguanylate cyclase/phosphodiesterase, partial [Candidatus Dormibacteraeota bacterium]|jgi:diguanylate cyclase (GGDEF)-like protein|nr:bifunctional diguanylate cyclase/phosphodiesterase [Candidatus Dormibacteraeota bacterium]
LLVSAALIGRLRDLLDRSYRELDFRAVHDTITGLPNRALLLQRLSQAMRFSKRLSGRVSLLYIDLDRFQEINSTLGRAAGDAVLAETAARLTAIAGEREIVARVGGDEFAMVLPGAEEPEAFEIANKVVRMLSTRVDVGDVSVESSATVGIATSSDHTALEPEALLHQAELTLEGARSSRSGIAAYSPQISQGQGGLALLNELRLAIETGQLAIQYQPQVSLKTGKTIAMEGLIRWQHPQLGLLYPGDFMPMAERSGLVNPLFKWILGTALDHCKHWLRSGLEAPVVVNLSIRNLLDPDLAQTVAEMLESREMEGRWLMLDANESDTLVDPTRIKANAAALLRLGVRISIDNFGMGYSSLANLNHLPIIGVKIHSSFVSRMAGNWSSEAIVRSMVGLIHSLGFQVIAVGVEDMASWRMLAELGCDSAQGFFIKGPTGVAALQGWVDGAIGKASPQDSPTIAPAIKPAQSQGEPVLPVPPLPGGPTNKGTAVA